MITSKPKGVHTKTGLSREFHVKAFTIHEGSIKILYDVVLLNKTDTDVATVLRSESVVLEDNATNTDYTDFMATKLGQDIIAFIQTKL